MDKLTMTLDESQDTCPCCGSDIWDKYFVEEWGQSFCEECLEREKEKWFYKILCIKRA